MSSQAKSERYGKVGLLRELRDEILSTIDLKIEEALAEEKEFDAYIKASGARIKARALEAISELDLSRTDHQRLKEVFLRSVKSAEELMGEDGE